MENVSKTVTILDVAKAAGVSPSTVSIILNGKGANYRISEATQEKVAAIAVQLNYRKNFYAKNLVLGSANENPIICLFWESFLEQGPLKEFYAGLMKYNQEHNYKFEISIQPYTPGHLKTKQKIIDLGLCQGAIVTGFSDEDRPFLQSIESAIPLVLFNRDLDDINSVSADNYAIGQRAAKCILAHHPSTLLCVNPTSSTTSNSKNAGVRFAGFYDTCIRAGVSSGCLSVYYDSNSYEGGYAAAEHLLSVFKPPYGIFISGDAMLAGFVKCITHHGLSIPGDAYIVCFGNNIACKIMSPTITSIFPPAIEMGYDCLKMIDLSLCKGINRGTIKTHKYLLTYRESCPEVRDNDIPDNIKNNA